MYTICITSAKTDLVSASVMPKHIQDSVQAQQPIGLPYMEGPEMAWTNNKALYQYFKTCKQRCELTLRSQLGHVTETQKVKSVFQWSGEAGLEICNI